MGETFALTGESERVSARSAHRWPTSGKAFTECLRAVGKRTNTNVDHIIQVKYLYRYNRTLIQTKSLAGSLDAARGTQI